MVKKIMYLMLSFMLFLVLIIIGQWIIKPANYSEVDVI